MSHQQHWESTRPSVADLGAPQALAPGQQTQGYPGWQSASLALNPSQFLTSLCHLCGWKPASDSTPWEVVTSNSSARCLTSETNCSWSPVSCLVEANMLDVLVSWQAESLLLQFHSLKHAKVHDQMEEGCSSAPARKMPFYHKHKLISTTQLQEMTLKSSIP